VLLRTISEVGDTVPVCALIAAIDVPIGLKPMIQNARPANFARGANAWIAHSKLSKTRVFPFKTI
jgi:hypothetical protein